MDSYKQLIEASDQANKQARQDLGIPESIKVDNATLLMALEYEGDLRYMLNNEEYEGADMGLPFPIQQNENYNLNVEEKILSNRKRAKNKKALRESEEVLADLQVENRNIRTDLNLSEEFEYAVYAFMDLQETGAVVDSQKEIIERIQKGLIKGAVSLTQFVCPPFDGNWLSYSDDTPQDDREIQNDYLGRSFESTDLLPRQKRDLEAIYTSIRAWGLHVTAYIGDDDMTYLSECGVTFPDYDNEAGQVLPNSNRESLIGATEEMLGESVTAESLANARQTMMELEFTVGDTTKTGQEIYDLIAKNPLELKDLEGSPIFTEEDIDREINEIKAQFAQGRESYAGGYYADLLPEGQELSEEQARQIAYGKLANYALQGLWMNFQNPNAILIQTEGKDIEQARLRNKMVNAGLLTLGFEPMPAIYLPAKVNLEN